VHWAAAAAVDVPGETAERGLRLLGVSVLVDEGHGPTKGGRVGVVGVLGGRVGDGSVREGEQGRRRQQPRGGGEEKQCGGGLGVGEQVRDVTGSPPVVGERRHSWVEAGESDRLGLTGGGGTGDPGDRGRVDDAVLNFPRHPADEDPAMAMGADEETGETASGRGHTPLSMLGPAPVLALGGIAVGLIPNLGRAVEAAVSVGCRAVSSTTT
jgi:hypothetical protein